MALCSLHLPLSSTPTQFLQPPNSTTPSPSPLIPNPSHKPRPGHKDALTHHPPPPHNKCPSAMRKRSGRRATVHPEREAAGVWNVKCAFSANGVTHLVLIKDLATSEPLPSELPLLEQVKGSPRKKWLDGVCRQPVWQRGGEEGNRAGGREREDAAFLRAPLSGRDSAGCGVGGAVLSGGGGGLLCSKRQAATGRPKERAQGEAITVVTATSITHQGHRLVNGKAGFKAGEAAGTPAGETKRWPAGDTH